MYRAPFDPDSGRGHAERVEDGLLRRFRAGLEERGHSVVPDHAAGSEAVRLLLSAGEAPVAGGEGEEDVAGAVGPDATDASQTDRGPLGQAFALVRQKRRVGGNDDDDRAVTRVAALDPPPILERARDQTTRNHIANRQPIDPQEVTRAVVGLHQYPHHPAAVVL